MAKKSLIEDMYEQEGVRFKNADDVRFYLELKEKMNQNDIESFNIDTLKAGEVDKNKYNARKITIDDHIFDSKIEAKYYLRLLEKKKNGDIVDFKLKPKFELQPKFKKDGKTFRKIDYVADFEIVYTTQNNEIIDTKGVVTPDFALKQKMFEFKYPDLSLKVLKYIPSYGGWIEYDDWRRKKREKKKKKNH